MAARTSVKITRKSNSFGPRFANRGRGGAVSARGGGVSGTAFNSRAQGLYDPRDPTDRPRNRMRSTSDEGDLIGEGGWTISPSGRHAWNNSSDTASSVSYAAEESSRKSESSTMPEWMEDGEDQDKGEFGDDTTSGTGSFDEHGRFQKKHHGHPVDIPEAKTSNVNRDLFVIERDIQHSTSIDDYNLVSSVERNAASQHMSGQCNSSSAQTHILNNEAETSRGGYSNVLCRAEAVGYHPSVPTQQTVSTASAIAPNTINQRTAQFFYIDPTKQERGPFEKMQMESWYKRGYFTDALEVRRHFETKYQTLGELIQLNGKLTPFDFKEEAPSQQPPVPPVFSNPSAQTFSCTFSVRNWNSVE
ncbi:hypothetical protein KIN20_031675 [Parelaphostrongylus tenuis]|uniref:GYF domain-containing protein n=1 Tax=Parelaphostrongylus tenuis TaxID=148309 RepID=A0AAD5WHT6_PARTN|nr:hypothetical protein KIN20_031675 [Parelaphostrongylus tenuis]